jgi:hypothetical protein
MPSGHHDCKKAAQQIKTGYCFKKNIVTLVMCRTMSPVAMYGVRRIDACYHNFLQTLEGSGRISQMGLSRPFNAN